MTYYTEVRADAPVRFYRFDDQASPSPDYSGNGQNATLTGVATFTIANPAGVIPRLFPSSANCVLLSASRADFTAVSLGDTFTFETWIRATTAGSLTGPSALLNQAAGTGIYLRNSKISVQVGGVDFLSDTPLVVNTNYHVVVSVSAGVASFYLNGVADGVQTTGITGFTPSRLWANTATTPAEFYVGYMDETSLYPTALSAARDAVHYAAGQEQPLMKFYNVVSRPVGSSALGYFNVALADISELRTAVVQENSVNKTGWVIRLYDRETGVLVDQVLSDAAGPVPFNYLDATREYYMLAFDDVLAAPDYNLLGYDRL